MNIKNKNIAGFTLVELMVGVVLTTLFVAGISQVFSRTVLSFKTQKTLSNMTEDARFILDTLNKEVRRTGFTSNHLLVNGSRAAIFHNKIAIDYTSGTYRIRNDDDVTPGGLLSMAAGEPVRGGSNSGSQPISDSLIIRYQLSSGAELQTNEYSSCTSGFSLKAGELNTHRHVMTIVFYVKKNTTVGSNVLYCRAARENLDTGYFRILNSKPLISNVERFRVLYGETTPAPDTTYYRTSAQVTDWQDVKSVRMSIALKSEEENILPANSTDYTINGQLSTTPLQPAEKRIYRVFSTTVAFRN